MRNNILFNLCLPILCPPDPESLSSPQDFLFSREDLMNSQSIDNIENAAGKLIEAYVDKIDGTTFELSNHLVNLIYFQLTANPRHFSGLSQQLTESYFFKKVNYLSQIECSLMVLSLISYTSPGRQEITKLVEELFVSQWDFFFKEENPGTLKSAVALCYSYYVDDFYQNVINRQGEGR